MSLVKEVVFITKLRQRLSGIQIIKDSIEANNGCEFLWTGANNFSESFFEGTLTDKQAIVQFFYANRSLALINKLHRFYN